MMINTSQPWQINNGNYDLLTVAIHEFGHALGLGESQIQQAVMYGTYTTIKQSLAPDDINGVDSIYGPRQPDFFMSTYHNSSWTSAASLNTYLTTGGRFGYPTLDLQSAGQSEWFKVTVPSSSVGTMAVTVQATGQSELSPAVLLYNSSLQFLGYGGNYNGAPTPLATLKARRRQPGPGLLHAGDGPGGQRVPGRRLRAPGELQRDLHEPLSLARDDDPQPAEARGGGGGLRQDPPAAARGPTRSGSAGWRRARRSPRRGRHFGDQGAAGDPTGPLLLAIAPGPETITTVMVGSATPSGPL